MRPVLMMTAGVLLACVAYSHQQLESLGVGELIDDSGMSGDASRRRGFFPRIRLPKLPKPPKIPRLPKPSKEIHVDFEHEIPDLPDLSDFLPDPSNQDKLFKGNSRRTSVMKTTMI